MKKIALFACLALALPLAAEIYRNDLKNREYVKEAPQFSSKLAGAEAAKLEKFSDAGGTKSGGCPTPTETDSSSCFSINVLVIAGSTRADSYNKKLAQEAAGIARGMGAKVTVIDLKDYPMPFYDADLEAKQGMPKNAKRFRDALLSSEAVVIASPEYNASIPAVLKNAIDWASRSEDGGGSHEAFEGKKFAIMSASPGRGGGVRGLGHLQSILEDVGGEVVEKQVSIPRAYEKGAFAVNDEIKEELDQIITSQE